MSDTEQNYERLTTDSIFQMQSSYLGKDHLLVVEGSLRERYRKVYYKDIEAVLYQPNANSKLLAAFCGVLALILLIIAVSSTVEYGLSGGRYFLWGVLILCVSIFGWCLKGGGSVSFGVQSAVQTVRLSGIGNKKKAERAVKLLSARIVAAQGSLDPDTLENAGSARGETATRPLNKPVAVPPSLTPTGAPPPLNSETVPTPEPTGDEDISRFAPPEDKTQ
ncbi:MAG: hypothetical protein ACPGN3_05845 [Opitutales bacterium]